MLKEKIEDGIVIATFEKERTNSIDMEVLRDLKAIVKKVNEDDALKGLILTGSGKLFSSGFDLPMFLSLKNVKEVVDFIQEEEEILTELFMCKKPVVSAMNGSTIAAGLIFSMAADYRIVTNHPKIKINMSEIKLGLPLSIAQSEIIRFGLESNGLFRDVMYFGKMFDVTKALELGIVDEVVEGEDLLERSKKIISLWIDNPGRAFIKLKEGLRKPIADRIRKRIAEENWQESLNCFFDKDVRATLEFVQKMM
ncbi:MAG: enoyl-CoA hydratase/isomerase family protein [Thermodesulfobacteriota bacterium]|nr:enoyl-CoA hydratase/isomerase family protein [Thermodesulfobacteriota bacterium]